MRGKILIAEDEDLTASLLMDILNELGYTAKIALDGREALELFLREDFDLLLTDLQMPNMNGLELIRRIRETPNGGGRCDCPDSGGGRMKNPGTKAEGTEAQSIFCPSLLPLCLLPRSYVPVK